MAEQPEISAYDVIETTDGGYLLIADTESFGAGSTDIWVIKTDGNGKEQWNQTFGRTGKDRPWALIETLDGDYLLAGETNSFDGTTVLGKQDMWLVKTDSNGIEQWNITFGGPREPEVAYDVIETSDGGILLVGQTETFGAGSADMWLIKIDIPTSKQSGTQLPGFLIVPFLIAFLMLLRRPNQKLGKKNKN